MRKPRSKSKKNHYFTKDTEMAIVEYARTEDINLRTKLYIEHIQPAFNELVDKIVYTYKFTSLQNVDHHKEDCKIWLTTILDKYNPDRGTKAFSYFNVVITTIGNVHAFYSFTIAVKAFIEIVFDAMDS